MSTATLALPVVSEFAAAVRAALSDLSPEEVDDLTDGLEADLTDRLAEQNAAELGDPRAYAEELRAAAGLPHRSNRRPGRSSEFAELRKAPGIIAHDVRLFVASHPVLARLRDFFVAIRPVWWVFRALAFTALFSIGLGRAPITGYTVVIGIVALVLSVQFGRGKWLPFAWMRGMLLAVNIVLIMATPLVLAGWTSQLNDGYSNAQYLEGSGNDLSGSGLMENGSQVSNIFAYDAQGNPLTDVQLYDQDGKPLDLNGDPGAPYSSGDNTTFTVPNDAVTGRPGWNVFPLAHVNQSAIGDDGTVKSSAHRIPAELPFAMAKPLAGSEAAPVATPAPTPLTTSTPAP